MHAAGPSGEFDIVRDASALPGFVRYRVRGREGEIARIELRAAWDGRHVRTHLLAFLEAHRARAAARAERLRRALLRLDDA